MTKDQTLDQLDGDLTLRAVETDADADRVVAINAAIHGSDVGDVVRHWLFAGHPATARPDWLLVEDPATGRVAATLSLLPVTWRYGDQPLPVAEMGMVATLPDYRGRGLQRLLSQAFDRLARERGYTLAAIEGIPGFYGQFGYAYAIPLDRKLDLEFDQVPEGAFARPFTTRPATPADGPALQSLYDASLTPLDLAALRDEALWRHQLSVPPQVTFYGKTTVIQRADRLVGYLRWNDDDWSDRLRILELAVQAGPDTRQGLLTALRFARERALSAEKRGLRLDLPPRHPLAVLARYLGGTDRGHYGWQMRVLDPVGFMWAIKRTLEARLAGSLLAGYSGTLLFNLYRSRLRLRFEGGRLVEVNTDAGEQRADAGMGLKQATQLWLGWRGREALEAWYPDVWSRDAARHLLDLLFPQTYAHIYMAY